LIDQKVSFVKKAQKRKALEKLLREPEVEHTLVFSRTKHGANRIVRHLEQAGIAAATQRKDPCCSASRS
jgi:ATP-dependent RNA helicase RhlE